MNRSMLLVFFIGFFTSALWAAPAFEGDWSKVRRYGHGQERAYFTEAQLEYIDNNIAYLTTEKIHAKDLFDDGNIDQAAMKTAEDLQNTKVLLYLSAFFAYPKYQDTYAADFSNTDLFVPVEGGLSPYAFNQGNADTRDFWASISDDVVNNSKVAGTFVDSLGKFNMYGYSEWMPEFIKTMAQLEGVTVYNAAPSYLLDYSDGSMREDFIEGDMDNMRDSLDLFLQVPDDEYLMLNSFHSDYQFALAGFLIIANDNSFLRLNPQPEGDPESHLWNDVLWHCDEYDKPLGPPKGKGVRVSDWVYKRSFEYADVTLDLENTTSTITWYEAPVAHWNMEDGSGSVVSDVSGNGYDGTLSGGEWVSARSGGAIELNGSISNDSVSIPSELFETVENEITIAMWVRGDAEEQPSSNAVFRAEDSDGNGVLVIILPHTYSKLYWDAGNSGDSYDRISKNVDLAEYEGLWNHWTFTKNAETRKMKIYLNGELWESRSGKTLPITGIASAFLGAGSSKYYEGALDDVRIYNSVLSDSEIAVLAETRPVATPDSLSVDEDASVVISLSGTDMDDKTDSSLTYTIGIQPANGELSGTASELTYIPDADFFGSDRFFFVANDGSNDSYTGEVSITVNGVKDAPVASEQNLYVKTGESVDIVLTSSDVDGESDLHYEVVTDPEYGSLNGTAPNLTYTPNDGYLGADSFNFMVSDSYDDSTPATVTISVNQEVSEVVAAYDFDDGTGSATTTATLIGTNVIAGDFGVGTGLNNVVDISTAYSLAENIDAEGNIFGTDNPISFGGSRNNLGFVRGGTLDDAIDADAYITFAVTPTNDASMDLSRLTFRAYSDETIESANAWTLYSSVDSFAQAIATGESTVADGWADHVIDLSASSFQSVEESVEFRLYIYSGRNDLHSTTLFDKVIVHGSAN